MVVLEIIDNSQWGGAERYSRLLAKQFISKGHTVYHMYPPGPYSVMFSKQSDLGIHCIEFDLRKNILKTIFFIRHLILEKGITFVHSNQAVADFAVSMALVGVRNVYFSTSVHCMIKFYLRFGIAKLRQYIMYYVAYHKADAVIAVSTETKDVTQSYYFLNHEKVHVIHNSLDYSDLFVENESVEAVRLIINPENKWKIIISTGRLDNRKGQEWIIRALGEYLKDLPIRIVLLGEGENRSLYEKLAKQYGVEDRVYMPGIIRDVNPWYAASDYYVHSAQFEGLSCSLLEAMFFRLPIVATDIPSNSEVILDTINGLTYPYADSKTLADKIRFLYENPHLANKYGENAREKIDEGFEISIMSKKILNLMGKQIS